MLKRLTAAICSAALLLTAAISPVSVFAEEAEAEMCLYKSYYEGESLFFGVEPQGAPWDTIKKTNSDKAFIPQGEAAIEIPFQNHKNHHMSIYPLNRETRQREYFDLEAIKRTGEIRFKIYIETEDYSAERDRLYIAIKNDAKNSWRQSDNVYLPEFIETGKWVEIKIPIRYFALYEKLDYENMAYMVLKRSGAADSAFNLYIKDFEIYARRDINFSVREENGKIKMRYFSGLSSVNKFVITKNGKNLATKGKTTNSYEVKYGQKNSNITDGEARAEYGIEVYNKSSALLASAASYPEIKEYSGSEYNRPVSTEARLVNYYNKSVIFRGEVRDYIKFGSREYADNLNENVMAYEKGGEVYVPAEAVISAFGKDIAEERLFEIGAERKNSHIFAPAAALSEELSIFVVIYKDMAIFSAEAVEYPESILGEIYDRMGYNRKHAYLGSLGYITGVYKNPANPERIYCKTDVGGIYEFSREEEIWVPLIENVPHGVSGAVRSVGFDPNDEDTIYVTIGGNWYEYDQILLKTTDSGKSWRRLSFPYNTGISGGGTNESQVRLMGESIAVDPNNSNIVYCGTYDSGLKVSFDGGESFSAVEGIPSGFDSAFRGGVSAVIISGEKTASGASSDIYVGVLGHGVYESHNGGESFSLIPNSPKAPFRMALSGDKLYISATSATESGISGGFFCYENGSIKDLTPSESTVRAFGAFLVDEDNPNMIMIVTAPYRSTDYIYRSFDGGATWSKHSAIYNPCSILQDPIDRKGVWVPTGKCIYYVKDMYAPSMHYETRDRGVEELVCTEVTSVPTGSGAILHTLVMDHGHTVSENINEYAERPMPNFAKGTGIDYCEEDSRFVFRSGYRDNDNLKDSVISVSSDYGKTFSALEWNKDNRILDVAVSAKLQSNGYPVLMMVTIGDSSYEGRGIWRSKDFGASWEKVYDGVSKSAGWDYGTQLFTSDRVDSNVFYYEENENLYITKDGGASWGLAYKFPKTTSETSKEFMKAVSNKGGEVWIRRSEGIYVSKDFGASFSLLPVDSAVCFGFGAGKTAETPAAYVLGIVNGEYGIHLSDDLGKTWRMIADSSMIYTDFNDICGDGYYYGRCYGATSGTGVVCYLPAGVDEAAPELRLDEGSREGSFATDGENFKLSGRLNEAGRVWINGEETEVDGYNRFEKEFSLSSGINRYEISFEDEKGNQGESVTVNMRNIPGFYKAFYNGLDSKKTDVSTYIHTGGEWNGEYQSRMAVVSSDEASELFEDGEYGIRMNITEKNRSYQINRVKQDFVDLSALPSGAELRFKIAIKTSSVTEKTAKNLGVNLANDASVDYAAGARVALSEDIKANSGWYDVRIKVSDLLGGDFDPSKTYGLHFLRTSAVYTDWKVYVKDIVFTYPLMVEETEIFDESGKAVDKIVPGGSYTVSVTYNNLLNGNYKPAFIAALYDGEMLLETSKIDTVAVKSGESYKYVSEAFYVPEEVSSPRIKAFLWYNLKNLKPINAK